MQYLHQMQRVSFFSSALKEVLDQTSLNQAELAKASDMSASQLSRYVSGYSAPTRPVMDAILKAVPAEFRPRVLIAFLHDSIPPEYFELVDVLPASRTGEPLQPEMLKLPPGLDPEMRRMLEAYAELGLRHPQIREMLKNFLGIVQGI